jgi:hypothetical protein
MITQKISCNRHEIAALKLFLVDDANALHSANLARTYFASDSSFNPSAGKF